MRRCSTHRGGFASISALVLASGLLLVGRPADANEDCPAPPGPHCRSVKGKFHSAPPPTCASPVGFCTAGELTGNLRGSYAFVMTTLGSSNVRELPGVFFYTGQSVVTLRGGAPGTLLGIDTGTVDLEPTGTHAMAAILTISGGTGTQARKQGHLVLRGKLDLESGEVDGDYQGEVCEP